MNNKPNNIFEEYEQLKDRYPFDYKSWFNLLSSTESLRRDMEYNFGRELACLSSPFITDGFCSDPLSCGLCGDNVYWKVSDGVLYIDGTGDMWDFTIDPCEESDKICRPWIFANYDNVIIRGDVTSVGAYAFAESDISGITIPTGVQSIRVGAFFQTSVSQLELPSTLQTVESGIIEGDPCGIKKLIISANIPDIAPEAFNARSGSPKEIVLTGDLPEDLSALVKSHLFIIECPKISYPQSWNTDSKTFFDRICEEINKQQDDPEWMFTFYEEDFNELKETLIPYSL